MGASSESLGGGGKQLAIGARINDATGVTITIATAGTTLPLKHATLFPVGVDDTGGAITWDGTTGLFTVAKQHACGKYLAIFNGGNVKGTNAHTPLVSIFAKEGGVAAAVKGPVAIKTEPATATEGNMTAMAIVNLSAVGDTVEVRCDSNTNSDVVIVKQCLFELIKIA